MKNLNFFERLWEHSRTLRRVGLVLVMCLITITQAWADQSVGSVYAKFDFNGEEKNYEYWASDNKDNPVWNLGDLTSGNFKFKEVYWKCSSNWSPLCNAKGYYKINGGSDQLLAEYVDYSGYNGSYEIQNTNVNNVIATANTGNSGAYECNHWFYVNFKNTGDGWNTTVWISNTSKNYTFKYNILPPNATAITATPTGAISGSGTELDPYIVPYGGNLTIALSGSTKEREDANSSVQYSVDGGGTWGTSSKIFSNVTATSLQNFVFKARCYNSTASLASPSETTKTVYYKAANAVPLYKFVVNTGVGNGNVCATDNTDYPQTVANGKLSTLIGGTLTARGNGSESHLKYNNNSFNFNGGTNFYLKVVTDSPLKTGDIIRYINSNSGSVAIRLTQNSSTKEIVLAGNSKSTIQFATVTSDFNGQTTFYIDRKSNTSYLEYFEILRSPYTITLNATTNGGTVSPTAMYFAASDPLLLPRATKSSNRFKGWYTGASNDVKVSDYYTATGTTTLYAQFDECTSSGTVYKFQVKTTGLANNTKTEGDLNVGNFLSTLDGGTAVMTGTHAQIVNNNAISFANNGDYITVDLDCALQTGDTIITTISGSKSGIKITSTSSTTSLQNISYGTKVKTIVPSGLNNYKTFRLYEQDTNCGGLSYFEIKRPAKYTITHDISNVTKTSGETEVIHKSDYTAVYAAAVGYELPDAVTVMRGATNITASCTWTKASGTLFIPAAQVTGNITITVTGVTPACTTPTASWATAPANGNVGGNMNATLTTNYATGVVYTSSNTDVATVSGDGTTTCTINYVAAGSARITATVTGDGATICTGPATCYTDITVSRNTPTQYEVSGTAAICSGSNTDITLANSQTGASYQLKKNGVAQGDPEPGTDSELTWSVSEVGTYTVSAVETAKYTAREMTGSAIITFKTNTAIETQPTSIAHANVGAEQTLSVEAIGSNLTYQWQTCNSGGTEAADVTGASYSGGKTSTLTFTPSGAGVTYYKCVVTGDCGSAISDVVSITAKNAISPTLTYASTSIAVGAVTAVPTVGGNTGSGSVSYTSSATGVATVDSDGKVTAKAVGSATITATIAETASYWGNTATATFTIGKGSISPTLSYDAATLTVGGNSSSPTITGNTGSGGVTYSVTSADPSGSVTVNASGIVTAVHAGTATITATIAATDNYNSGSATYNFTINKASISPTLTYAGGTSIVVGDVTAAPTVGGNAGSGDVSFEVTSASPAGCITVDDETGAVTAVSAGTATVTATIAATTDYNGNTATADFTISACSPTTLASMTITGTSTATATVGTAAVSLGEKDKSDGYKLGSNGHYARVTISSGYLQQGDVLSVEVTTKPDGNKLYIYKYVSDTWTQLGEVAASSAGSYTYTLTAENVTSDFDCIGLYRTGGNQNPFVKSMTVTRPCAATTYSVTYADGGATDGDVPEDNNTYDEGDEVTVLGNTGSLEKTGYTFAGWNDGSTDYDADETFTMPAEDVTLTAQWTPNNYTITYNLNGASWAGGYSAPSNYTVGTGATLPVAGDMTNTGYTFVGWYGNSSLTGSVVTTISTSDYGNKPFWAKWTENTYTITYNKNNGSASGSTAATEGHYVTVASCGFELDGYLFTGWNTESNGTGESYGAGEDIELTANMTLYAQWATDYTISWGDVIIGGSGATVTPNLGGGNYMITANTGSWTGSLDASMISSETSGVTITNVAVSNGGSPKTITVTFAVGAEVVGESIGLTLSVPAAGVYSAKESTKAIAIDRCTGSGDGSDGVLFSAEFKDSGLGTSNICDAANTAYTFTTAELKSAATGGSIKAYTTSNLSHMKFATNAISIAGSNGVIQIDLDNAIQTNDLFTYLNVNSGTSSAYLRHTSADNETDQIALTGYNSREKKVMLPAGYNGKMTLYVVRNNNDFKLHKAAVVRPAFLMLLRDDTPTASSTNLVGTNVELTTENYLTTIQGGNAYYTSPSSGNLKIYRSSSKNYINFNSQAGYLKIVLDEALQAGDVIGFDSYNTNNLALTTTDVRSTSIVTTNQLYTVGSSSPLKGQTTFYIWQNGGSSDYLRGLQIARSGAAGGGGGTDQITTTLSWDPVLNSDPDWNSGENRLNKETGDADFTFAAVQDKNSLGALTYSSSNTGVATVTAGGTVHIVGAAGDATITATMAESGCYKEATISYNIQVVDNCDDTPGHVMAYDLGCEGTRLFAVLYGGMNPEDVLFQWYRDGVSLGEEYRAQQCTVRVAGEYYAVVDNTAAGARHCAMATDNTVEVEAHAGISAEKIVDQWYVKNGRRTPDIALVQTTGATGFIVKIGDTKIWDSNGSVITGYAGCGFRLGENGIIYLNGTKDNGDAPSGLTGDGETEILKITAKGCGGEADELSITIHKQVPSLGARPSVAFVVDGTEKGRFDQPNADHSTNSALYQFLDYTLSGGSGQLDLTAQNIYSSVDEKELLEHYSQFDAIIITDDPSTGKKKDGKSYVDAMGALIDVRPILTMEAFVSKLANWKAKGINGNPESPSPRQYAMTLQCKDHEIFGGLSVGPNVQEEEIDGVDYWTVTMVDKTKSPYSSKASDTDDTGGTPALQGFSASDVSGLLLLGEIKNGDKTMYAGVERQEEPAARLMLLGLNNKALPNALTTEGKLIVENAVRYLLKTNMEEVDDCSNYFVGTIDKTWDNPDNWAKKSVPNSPMMRVRILAPCEVSTTVHAAHIDIVTSGESSKKGGEMTGQLTIKPNGAVIVGGEVRAAEAPYFNKSDLKPTEEQDLVIETNGSNQGALILNNDAGDTKATVEYYSLGRKDGSVYQFQYFASPMGYLEINPAFAGAGIYTYAWNEAVADGWERRAYYTDVLGFEGLAITTKRDYNSTYTLKGALASTADVDIPLTYTDAGAGGQNLIGNSWTAPINIASLVEAFEDDANVDKTVNIYNSGNDDAQVGAAGTWTSVPISVAEWPEWEGLKVIPAMQAFRIDVTSETKLTMNYEKMVRETESSSLNEPLKAPSRRSNANGASLMRMRLENGMAHTDLFLIEGGQFSDAFDNGYEAKFIAGEDNTVQFYAMNGEEKMAVLATDALEGTPVGFVPGKGTAYTISFSGEGKGYYLNDVKKQTSTLISEENTYSFDYEAGDDANRFYISTTPFAAPSVATDLTNMDAEAPKVMKVIYNDKLYIIRGGKVFSADGQLVK